MVTDYDRTHMADIIAGRDGTWFTAYLLRLIAKADSVNRERLRIIYPDAVAAYEDWRDNRES